MDTKKDQEKALEKANAEHRKALRARNKKDIGDNAREHLYCSHMLHWATLMARADPYNAARWSREAAEWSKRVGVALDSIANDKLDSIWADIRANRHAAKRLADLAAKSRE